MVDVTAFADSLKITWLKKYMITYAQWTQLVANEIPNIQNILCYGSKKLKAVSKDMNNVFWKDLVTAFARFTDLYKPEIPDILSEYV